MSEKPFSIETLEKQLRVLRRKLERSERHRAELEDQRDRDQLLYKRLHAEIEAARREAQIEAALEHVRARAMAMHHSEELREVVSSLFDGLESLGFDAEVCNIDLFDPETWGMQVWASHRTEAGVETYQVFTPYLDHPFYQGILEAFRQKLSYHVFELFGEQKKSFDALFFEQVDYSHIPEAVRKMNEVLHEKEGTCLSAAFTSHGLVVVSRAAPLRDDEVAILKRFAKVVDLTYTRFLDLQKAEAQAREAQIEAALERVRARTIAMHQSDELAETAAVLFRELEALAMLPPNARTYITLVDTATETAEVWMTRPDGAVRPGSHRTPLTEHPSLQAFRDAWKRGEPLLVRDHAGAALDDYLRYVLTLPHTPEDEGYQRLAAAPPERIVMTDAFFSEGTLGVMSTALLKPDAQEGLRRFARLFEQTYTRFLDLKKAEAQAREAQIEAALERVRAKAMAMHNSNDLSDATAIVFTELEKLGISTHRCGIIINHETTKQMDVWMATATAEEKDVRVIGRLDMTIHPALEGVFEAWKKQQPFYAYELAGKDMENYYKAIERAPDYSVPERQEYKTMQRQVVSTFNFPEGALFAFTGDSLTGETIQIFKRFASVFALTYRRYLDLKQAEEQAREAQIEAALERVRARAMGMHHSDELREVVSKVFEEFQRLDLDAPACSIGVFEEATRSSEWWVASTSETILPRSYRIPYLEGWPKDWYQRVYDNWQQGVPFFACSFEGEDKRALDHKLLSETEFGLTSDALVEDLVPLERLILSYATLSHGVLEVGTTEPIPEDQASVLQRFAKVIDLTYTRFDDLQQAEARVREAVRDASLDRVRAEIASMRTAADLQRITPLVWRELTTLGVPFFRCGVFIIDEAAERVHTYLSTPEGQSIAVLHLPFDSAETTREAVEHWRRQQVYTDLWDRQQFVAWMQTMIEQGHIDAAETYKGGAEPLESLALQFVPFTQGMLYVGSAAPLSDDQIDLVQALADAFSVAYARYEDFTKLEAAKAEVEATLSDLKATQAQLIHSEKMASLGQMTAGIAHEIKNPLNFVNNFADLNDELFSELLDHLDAQKSHLDAGTREEIEEVIETLKLNAAQIAKHGRRADDIVRSMMQHARDSKGERTPTAINALVEEYVNLAFHGMRASTPGFTVEIERAYSEAVGQAPVMAQEIGRVLLNLLSNAFYAVHEHAARINRHYEATVTVTTQRRGEAVEIRVSDNGPGIPTDIKDRIFEPFFTTKPTGSGTGLGLSLSYDIVTQGHGGTLTVESTEGEGAAFVITLPTRGASRLTE